MKDFFQLISPEEFSAQFRRFSALETESVPLAQALGRIPAATLAASEDLPAFPRSTMDGFAVRARDTFGCSESEPALLELVGEIPMGSDGSAITLRPGQTARIWTGGYLPTRADSVVMVEYTQLLDDQTVEIFRPVAPGENCIRAGEDFSTGETIFPVRRPFRPQDLGVLAGLGMTEVEVQRLPKVGIISTGDELVPPGETPGPGQIRDINSTTLAALVQQAGGQAATYGIIPDDLDLMLTVCEEALQNNDILLISGGSSVGRRDFTLDVLNAIENSELLVHGVAIRPGKPTLLAARGNQAIFGLPGHVASAIVVFFLFVRPMIRLMSGLAADHGMQELSVITGEPIPSAIGREEYVRVRLESSGSGHLPYAFPVYGKSGLLKPLVKADGLLVIGRDVEGLDKNARATVLLFENRPYSG